MGGCKGKPTVKNHTFWRFPPCLRRTQRTRNPKPKRPPAVSQVTAAGDPAVNEGPTPRVGSGAEPNTKMQINQWDANGVVALQTWGAEMAVVVKTNGMPFWGFRCTHFRTYSGFGMFTGVRDFDPWPTCSCFPSVLGESFGFPRFRFNFQVSLGFLSTSSGFPRLWPSDSPVAVKSRFLLPLLFSWGVGPRPTTATCIGQAQAKGKRRKWTPEALSFCQ